MKTKFLMLFILILALSCSRLGYDNLKLVRESYQGDELKLSGYYYSSSNNSSGQLINAYFFYNNGVIHYSGSVYSDKFWSQEYQDGLSTHSEASLNSSYAWGLYRIRNSNINYEKWEPSSGGEPHPTIRKHGVILNDTTFQMNQLIQSNGLETSIEELYHFKAFSPKPDSTNVFIK